MSQPKKITATTQVKKVVMPLAKKVAMSQAKKDVMSQAKKVITPLANKDAMSQAKKVAMIRDHQIGLLQLAGRDAMREVLITHLQKLLADRNYTASGLGKSVEKRDHNFMGRICSRGVEEVLCANPTLFRHADDYDVTDEWTKCKTFNLTHYVVKDKLPSGDKRAYVAPARPEFSHLVSLRPGELPADELLDYKPEHGPPKGATLVLVARQMEKLEHSSPLAAALAQLVLGAGGDIVYRKPA